MGDVERLGIEWISAAPHPLACYDCLLPYGRPGWCDTFIPSDVWARISPTGDEGGILCVTCMARRLVALGISDVPLIVGSGPWAHDPERARLDGLRQGREQAAAHDAEVAADARREALREAADAWTQLPMPTPRAVPVITYSNRVGDWLRARADREAAPHTPEGAPDA